MWPVELKEDKKEIKIIEENISKVEGLSLKVENQKKATGGGRAGPRAGGPPRAGEGALPL